MRVFISGGCKNGKSGRAEQLARALRQSLSGAEASEAPRVPGAPEVLSEPAALGTSSRLGAPSELSASSELQASSELSEPATSEPATSSEPGAPATPATSSEPQIPLYYVATMVSSNSEDDNRIARHQENREGFGFTTVEITNDIHLLAAQLDTHGVILLDSLTALLLNEMIGSSDSFITGIPEKIAADLVLLAESFQHIVFVSDYIYSDAALYDDLTTEYRRGLALLDRTAATLSDVVVEACFGNYTVHKGAEALALIGGDER